MAKYFLPHFYWHASIILVHVNVYNHLNQKSLDSLVSTLVINTVSVSFGLGRDELITLLYNTVCPLDDFVLSFIIVSSSSYVLSPLSVG